MDLCLFKLKVQTNEIPLEKSNLGSRTNNVFYELQIFMISIAKELPTEHSNNCDKNVLLNALN
jgi:hypothetical protein